MVEPSPETLDSQGKPDSRVSPAARDGHPPRDSAADGYEYWLEIIGSLLLAVIGLLLWLTHRNLGEALGANLLAAGCVALVVFIAYGYLFRKRRQQLTANQSQLLTQIAASTVKAEERSQIEGDRIHRAITAGVEQAVSEFHAARQIGLSGFDIGRPIDEINKSALQALKRVDILEVSLKTMQNITLTQWQSCQANVRIILLDPLFPKDHPLACQRDREEEQAEGQILKEIHSILKTFPPEWLSNEDDGSVGKQVKLAQVMPTLSYFRIDDVAYFAPLLHKQLGNVTMHLRLNEGGELFDALATHFEKLWEDKSRVVTVGPGEIPSSY